MILLYINYHVGQGSLWLLIYESKAILETRAKFLIKNAGLNTYIYIYSTFFLKL